MSDQIQDMKYSYYEYVKNIHPACLQIAEELREGHFDIAFQYIGQFAEGINWLVQAEKILQSYGYTINSRILEANLYFEEINHSLEIQDFVTIADLFEYEIAPLFSSAAEWTFVKKEDS